MNFPDLFMISILAPFFFTSIAAFFPNSPPLPPPHDNSVGVWDTFHNLTGCRAGQHVDGVAKLKQYFQRFGYINNSPNLTDDFDDDLESAIKTYQLNFNLATTGNLDGQTLNQIVRPRCGVADVIDGSSSMNAGKSPHIHTVARYEFFPGTPKWVDLTYAFLPANNLSDPVKSAISSAFRLWSTVIPRSFTETTSYGAADIKFGFYKGDHGDGAPFDGVGGILGHSFAPPDGRFHLDGDERWATDLDLDPTSYDVETVALHEIGHLLGLGHSSDTAAVMYPTVAPGKRKVELGSDDIEGIQALYGSNPNYEKSEPVQTYWLLCEP